MPLFAFGTLRPVIDPHAFIAPDASIVGDVTIGAQSSVWFHCTLRGDVNVIRIGERTNIQDQSIVHVSSTGQGTFIGADVTVGHGVILHACTIGDGALIGMQACVMDDCHVENQAILAAGSLLTQGKTVPSGQVWAGRPARFLRDMTQEDFDFLHLSSARYVALARTYRQTRPIPLDDTCA